MLEHYFLRPETVDRIRSSWIGDAIDRYVTWLAEHGYASRNVLRRVPIQPIGAWPFKFDWGVHQSALDAPTMPLSPSAAFGRGDDLRSRTMPCARQRIADRKSRSCSPEW